MSTFDDDELAILQNEQKVYKSSDVASRSIIITMVVKKLLSQRDSEDGKDELTAVSIYFTKPDIHDNLGF
jgi:hypothetical protein